MAFGCKGTAGITAETEVYAPAAGKDGTVIGMTVTPTAGADATVTVKYDGICMVKDLKVTVGTAEVLVGGQQKLVVPDTKSVKLTSDQDVDVIVSYLE